MNDYFLNVVMNHSVWQGVNIICNTCDDKNIKSLDWSKLVKCKIKKIQFKDELYHPLRKLKIRLSIDGGATKNEHTEEYVYPYTYGRLVVHEVYKGNL